MDPVKPSQSREELIEDYLFKGYQPKNIESTNDGDQQFAKPIEDEDMFGDLIQDNAPASNSQSLKRKRWAALRKICKMPAPKKFAADCDEDGMIGIGAIEVVPEKPEPKSTAKEIFQKALSRRVKDKFGLYRGQKLYFDRYSDYLQKKMSAEKRQRWNSLHCKSANFDDEEEIIGGWSRGDEANQEEPSSSHDQDEPVDDGVNSDNNGESSVGDEEAIFDRDEEQEQESELDADSDHDEEPASQLDDESDISDESEESELDIYEDSDSELDLGKATGGLLLDEADSDNQSRHDDDEVSDREGDVEDVK